MRVLIARRALTGLLLPRMAVSAQTCAAFAAAVAAEMGLPSSAIEAEVIEAADDAVVTRVSAALAAGVRSTGAVVWPDGDLDAALVAGATDVDAVTTARQTRLLGGSAATLERIVASVHYGRIHTMPAWPDGRPMTPTEKAQARTQIATDRILYARIERVSAEGRDMKQRNGWA